MARFGHNEDESEEAHRPNASASDAGARGDTSRSPRRGSSEETAIVLIDESSDRESEDGRPSENCQDEPKDDSFNNPDMMGIFEVDAGDEDDIELKHNLRILSKVFSDRPKLKEVWTEDEESDQEAEALVEMGILGEDSAAPRIKSRNRPGGEEEGESTAKACMTRDSSRLGIKSRNRSARKKPQNMEQRGARPTREERSERKHPRKDKRFDSGDIKSRLLRHQGVTVHPPTRRTYGRPLETRTRPWQPSTMREMSVSCQGDGAEGTALRA